MIIAANGVTGESVAQITTDGHADLVALSRMSISNSDLPDRLRNQRPLTPYDCSTFYGGDGRGCTDYAPDWKTTA
jgi:N-ethylmaleimide reductase